MTSEQARPRPASRRRSIRPRTATIAAGALGAFVGTVVLLYGLRVAITAVSVDGGAVTAVTDAPRLLLVGFVLSLVGTVVAAVGQLVAVPRPSGGGRVGDAADLGQEP